MQRAIVIVGGLALIALGLSEVFSAVLHYDHHGPLTSRLYRAVWWLVRTVATPLPRRARDYVRSYGLPLMVVAAVGLWVLLPILGFSLLYYDGFQSNAFLLSEGLSATYRTALYASAVTLSTLGYGDVTPLSFPYGLLTAGESLAGFAILTFTISYLISVYQVLTSLDMLTAGLQHQSDAEDEVVAILAPHFPDGQARALETRLHDLHQALLTYYEGLHRYPLIYYFCSDRPFNFMPYTFLLIGEIIAALRWGLPRSHQVSRDPWLLALVTDYENIMEYVRVELRTAGSDEGRATPSTLTSAEFSEELALAPEEQDIGVRRFLTTVEGMCSIAHADGDWNEELYARYRGWLEFARAASAFVRGTARDLGGEVAVADPRHNRLFV